MRREMNVNVAFEIKINVNVNQLEICSTNPTYESMRWNYATSPVCRYLMLPNSRKILLGSSEVNYGRDPIYE